MLIRNANQPHFPQTRQREQTRGLTQVELVAVGMAITIVACSLASAAKSARESSRGLNCQQRLGQIATAGIAYAKEDPGEQPIPLSLGDAGPWNTSPYSSYYGYGGKSGLGVSLDANTSIYGGSNAYLMGAPYRPLNNMLFKNPIPLPPGTGGGGRGGFKRDWTTDARLDLEVYRCPADTGFSGMHHKGWRDSGLTSYDYYGTSFAANVYYSGYSYLKSYSPYLHPLSVIPNPGNTVLYWENAARFAPVATNPDLDQSGCFWPYSPLGDMTARGWHGTPFLFNVAFSDGHVSRMVVKGYGNSPLEPPLHPLYGCSQVRGPGYQLDILPVSPAQSYKESPGGSYGGILLNDGGSSFFQIVE